MELIILEKLIMSFHLMDMDNCIQMRVSIIKEILIKVYHMVKGKEK